MSLEPYLRKQRERRKERKAVKKKETKGSNYGRISGVTL